MYPTGNLFIPVEHGRLEAILKEPVAGTVTAGAALVLHPHPLGGGTMHNKVVFQAAGALNDAGLATLKINFRGVGQSTGQHDEGRGEQQDVRDGLNYLAENFPNEMLTVCGFSFGSWVGLQVGIGDDRVKHLISIGTPLDKYDFSFLESCRKPLLFVHGSKDEFGDVRRLRELVERLERQTETQLTVISEADHFFDGQLDKLKRAINEWITARAKAANR